MHTKSQTMGVNHTTFIRHTTSVRCWLVTHSEKSSCKESNLGVRAYVMATKKKTSTLPGGILMGLLTADIMYMLHYMCRTAMTCVVYNRLLFSVEEHHEGERLNFGPRETSLN